MHVDSEDRYFNFPLEKVVKKHHSINFNFRLEKVRKIPFNNLF